MPIELFENLIIHYYGCVVEVVAAGREVTSYALIQLLTGCWAEEAGPVAEGSPVMSTALFFHFMTFCRASHPLSFLVLNPTISRHGDVNGRARLSVMILGSSCEGCHKELVLTVIVDSIGCACTVCRVEVGRELVGV